MTITFKEYDETDRADLVRCMEELQDFVAATDPHKRLRRLKEYGERYTDRLLKHIEEHNGLILFACDRGRIVGCIAGIIEKQSEDSLLEVVPTKSGGWMVELFVEESHRSSGLGRKLMQAMEDYFRQKGCSIVQVEAFAPNKLAHEFYVGLDYQDRSMFMLKLLE
jgi:GNAT superfamily N-acetyltransferase